MPFQTEFKNYLLKNKTISDNIEYELLEKFSSTLNNDYKERKIETKITSEELIQILKEESSLDFNIFS